MNIETIKIFDEEGNVVEEIVVKDVLKDEDKLVFIDGKLYVLHGDNKE